MITESWWKILVGFPKTCKYYSKLILFFVKADNSVDKNEKRLTEELALRDEIISELKAKLQLSEELVSQKTLQLAESQIKENARQYLEAEISSVKNICDRMCSRLEETDIKLKDATEQVKRHAGSMTNMSELQNQLKTAADWELDRMKAQLDANHQLLAERSVSILKLQQSELKFKEKYGNTLQDLTHKNTLVNLLNNELDAKNEQVSQVMKALKDKQDAVAKQQNTIRLLEEQAARSALMRTKHEERMAAMLLEIAQLKQCLSNHAHVMVANIEDMEAVRAQHQTFPQQDQ
ncbi:hypothetical protein KR054_011270 [Drosophila jambulina]|nr:hypothetical protein KR054_011270 [Drosophila jambulina]